MAHFRGTIEGNRGEASRLGTKDSGITSRINGWDIGLTTYLQHNIDTGLDEVIVYLTAGSNMQPFTKRLGVFTKEDLK